MRQLVCASLVLCCASSAQAQSLDIKPGLWEKTLQVEAGDGTAMHSTTDACITAERLDTKKTLQKLQQSRACKVTRQEASPKRLAFTLQCKSMTAETIIEVRSPELVVVTATTRQEGAAVSTSSEEWRFVKADCAGVRPPPATPAR